jgi:hypothetical protein
MLWPLPKKYFDHVFTLVPQVPDGLGFHVQACKDIVWDYAEIFYPFSMSDKLSGGDQKKMPIRSERLHEAVKLVAELSGARYVVANFWATLLAVKRQLVAFFVNFILAFSTRLNAISL